MSNNFAQALRSQPTNVQGLADLGAVGSRVSCTVPMSSPATPHNVIDWVDDWPTQSTRKWRYRSGFFMALQITSVLLSHPVTSWFLLTEIDESAGNLLNPGRSRIKVFMVARSQIHPSKAVKHRPQASAVSPKMTNRESRGHPLDP